jgi:hypothetical protein
MVSHTKEHRYINVRDYPRGTWYVGVAHILGTLIDEQRRALVVGHLSARDSIKGTLGEGSFTGEPKR